LAKLARGAHLRLTRLADGRASGVPAPVLFGAHDAFDAQALPKALAMVLLALSGNRL
jgi:hypothetical protein